MKNNFFKRAWFKAYKKGESPEKLASDLGSLKGMVMIKQYDPLTNQILKVTEEHNTLINQSKSTLIRLISQGSSRWYSPIDSAKLKVSRMRFSNNDPGAGAVPSKLLYYDLAEPSVKTCIPPPGDTHAGGSPNATITADPLGTILYSLANVEGNYVVGSSSNLKIYTLRSSSTSGAALVDHPPSHSTLKIELMLAGSVVETLYFYNPADSSNVYIYPRASKNPYKVVTVGTDTGKIIVYYAGSPSTVSGNLEKVLETSDNSQTFVYYDYNTSQWKFQIQERAGASSLYDTVRFSFERGKYNVINSIVPRDGYNTGRGQTMALRYSGNTAGDYYPVLSTIEYRDADTDFIDDYSVTFSVNMSAQYGNGSITLMSDYIKYKEAYLFNEYNEMFSALYLTNSFDKNALTAYFISWSLLAPL